MGHGGMGGGNRQESIVNLFPVLFSTIVWNRFVQYTWCVYTMYMYTSIYNWIPCGDLLVIGLKYCHLVKCPVILENKIHFTTWFISNCLFPPEKGQRHHVWLGSVHNLWHGWQVKIQHPLSNHWLDFVGRLEKAKLKLSILFIIICALKFPVQKCAHHFINLYSPNLWSYPPMQQIRIIKTHSEPQ